MPFTLQIEDPRHFFAGGFNLAESAFPAAFRGVIKLPRTFESAWQLLNPGGLQARFANRPYSAEAFFRGVSIDF
jgi:hypothetical protein